jgi:hypothetical protein
MQFLIYTDEDLNPHPRVRFNSFIGNVALEDGTAFGGL